MQTKTEYFALKSYVGDADRLRELREQMQAQHPDKRVQLADVFRLAVSSASAVVPNNLPPRPPDRP
jgi:hypothetical protein